MKAHYVSNLEVRAVQRAGGKFYIQKFNPDLARNIALAGEPAILRGTRTADPWENTSPAMTQAEVLRELRRYELDPQVKRFFGKNGVAI